MISRRELLAGAAAVAVAPALPVDALAETFAMMVRTPVSALDVWGEGPVLRELRALDVERAELMIRPPLIGPFPDGSYEIMRRGPPAD